MAFVAPTNLPLRSSSSSPHTSFQSPPRFQLSTTSITCTASDNKNSQPENTKQGLSRRSVLTRAASFALAAILARPSSQKTLAEIEYPNVGFLGGGEKVDVNNANVRAYQKFPGMYPTIAGLIVTNGPFENVDDVLKIPDLTDQQKQVLSKYKENLVAMKPTPEYELDKINNGLYK